MKSEFPITKWTKVGRIFGWFFSPLLLISLGIFTFSAAEGLNIDLKNGIIDRKASIELREVKDAQIFVNGNDLKVKTPSLVDVPGAGAVKIQLKKEGKQEWNKQLITRQGYVDSFSPVLFPVNNDFSDEQIEINNIYRTNIESTFFYEKKVDGKTLIYRYALFKQIFGVQVENQLFADITSLVTDKSTPDSLLKTKLYKIIPGNRAESFLLILEGEKAVLIKKNGINITLANVSPKITDEYYWSITDSTIIYKTKSEIYSIDIDSNRLSVIYRAKAEGEKIKVQFILESGLLYQIDSNGISELIQNTFAGNDPKKVTLPNFGNVLTGGITKAYNMLEKQGLIILQTDNKIYTYNTLNSDFRQLNKFEGEQIVFTDTLKQVVVTINSKNLSQLRYYNLEREESSTFTVNGADQKTGPQSINGFNKAQNLAIVYSNEVKFMDIDGANQVTFSNLNTPELAMATKLDYTVEIVIKVKTQLEKEPSPTTTSGRDKAEKQVLRFKKFEN